MYHNDESFFSIHSDKGVESRVISTLSKIMLDDDDYIKSYCVPSTSNIVQTNDAPIKESSRRAQSERIASSITLSTMCRPASILAHPLYVIRITDENPVIRDALYFLFVYSYMEKNSSVGYFVQRRCEDRSIMNAGCMSEKLVG